MPRTAMLTAALFATLIALPSGTPHAAETDGQPQAQTTQPPMTQPPMTQPPMTQPGTNQAPGMMGGGMMGQGMMGQGMQGQGMQGQGMQGQGAMPMPYGTPQGQAMPPGSYGQGPAWGGGPDWHRRMHEWMEGRQPGYGQDDGYDQGYGPMGRYRQWHEHGMPGGMTPDCPMGLYHGHMGPDMMRQGMMRQGMMRQGMMRQGMMRQGMMGGGYGLFYGAPTAAREVTVDEVRASLEYRLASHGNPNLKLGKVETQDGKIIAEIVTKDDSLVNRIAVDPKTGRWMPAN